MYHFLYSALAAPQLYLDPGSGSFLIQLALAAVLGIGVAGRLYWSKIKSLFNGRSGAADQATKTEASPLDDEQR